MVQSIKQLLSTSLSDEALFERYQLSLSLTVFITCHDGNRLKQYCFDKQHKNSDVTVSFASDDVLNDPPF